MGIELQEEERWSFLQRNHVMNIATVDPNGYPHAAPVWYLESPEDGCVYFNTPESSRKARDLREMAKASASIDQGREYLELIAVVIEGDVDVVDVDEDSEIHRQWCQKYFDQPALPDYMRAIRHGQTFQWFQLDPSRWISWNNSKIDTDRLS